MKVTGQRGERWGSELPADELARQPASESAGRRRGSAGGCRAAKAKGAVLAFEHRRDYPADCRARWRMVLLLYLAEMARLCDVAGLPLTHPLRAVWIAVMADISRVALSDAREPAS